MLLRLLQPYTFFVMAEEKSYAVTSASDASDSSDLKSRSYNPEKVVGSTIEVKPDHEDEEEEIDCFVKDPFRPFTDTRTDEGTYLTIRAVFVGICCGALVNASNVYLGLKTGWTFTANIFGVCLLLTLLYEISRLTLRQGHCRIRSPESVRNHTIA